jgi:hypothetical protein
MGGLNTYTYATANPILWVDTTGAVKWRGSLSGTLAAFAVGAGYFHFALHTDCINASRATAQLLEALQWGEAWEFKLSNSVRL